MTSWVLYVLAAIGLALPQAAGCYELTLVDAAGDDYGPGTYVYPSDPVFTAGSFDITRLTVRTLGSAIRFEIEVAGEIEDPWGSGAGFSLQSVDIYIDVDGGYGSGSTASLERRNVEFSPSSGWEYVVWCAPPFDGFQSHVIDSAGGSYYSGIAVSVDQGDDVITIDVPRSILGSPTSSWRYAVLMLSQNGYEPGRVRAVMEVEGQWVLGGGEDGQCDANVIDMVAESGVSQEALLANYDPVGGWQPVLVNRVDSSPPVISHVPPASWEAHIPLAVEAAIDDDVVVAASVFYRAPGGAFSPLGMERTGETAWRATVPGSEIDESGLEYYVFATDATNAGTLPDSSNPFAVTVTPDVTSPSVIELAAQPSVISPNGDGYKDTTLVTAVLSEPGHVWLEVRDSLDSDVRTLVDSLFTESTLTAAWDGRDESGEPVTDGTYTVHARSRDLAGRTSQPESTVVEVNTALPGRRLDAILLFHANQNLVPYGRAANRACYKGVLNTLRAHPSLKFVIHFSGCLLSDLAWSDPETIEILREGAADGQFEIVGSTYIQNIMYSTRISPDDFQFNQHQISLHRDQIERVIGTSPVSFWNPERVWTQNFVKLLTDNGYENVQIEDHILWDSGITGSEYAVRTTTYQGKSVNVFTDDKDFEGRVNGAIDSGDTASVMWFLRGLYDEDTEDRYAVCYHEDMEATGLWDYEGGEDPAVDFSNLDKLLTAFESDPRIKITTYSEFLENHEPYEDITPVVDGAAVWMGEDAWFVEDAEPQAEAYREFFDTIRDTLNAIHSTFAAYQPDTLAARNLIDHAWFTLCAHQYEFAVHGYGGIVGTTQWDLARTAFVSARAAREAMLAVERVALEDINEDGIDEVVFVTSGDLFVFSRYGGRLLYWFDLDAGTELVGNENFMRRYGEPYTDDNAYVEAAVGCEAYPWLCGNMIIPEVHDWVYEARRRCLNDSVWIGGESAGSLVDEALGFTVDSSLVDFDYDLGPIAISKRVSPALHSLAVEYTLTSASPQTTTVDLEVENGLCPGCLEVMITGRDALRYWDGNDTSSIFTASMRGVANVMSGCGLLFDFADPPASVSGEEDVFGLEINPRWSVEIPPYGSDVIAFDLDLGLLSGVDRPGIDPPGGGLLVFPNPSRGSVQLRMMVDGASGAEASVFDLSGRLVRKIACPASAGWATLEWDGLDWSGRPVADGIYFVSVTSGTKKLNGKVVLLK